MKRTRRSIVLAPAQLAAAAAATTLGASAWPGLKWLAFYGPTAPEAVLATYDLVILDPTYRGDVAAISGAGTQVCGYLSLGEVRLSDGLADRIAPAALLDENPLWPGTRRVDVRHPQWSALLVEQVIPAIAARGFTGLLLDTMDTPAFLEATAPQTYRGMRQASIELVQAIRRAHPQLKLIVNRGYAVIADIVDAIDAILAESLLTSADPGRTGRSRWNQPAEIAAQLALLAPATRHRKPPCILGLEYWDRADLMAMRLLYRTHRQMGHHPYVGTRLLDEIVPEPRA